MKIIILEGIATSGKTTIKNKLIEAFIERGVNFSVVEEDETLMPILDNTDKQVSINLLRKVIDKELKEEKDFIIFDRLFFTHIFRTDSSIGDFKEIENLIENKSFLAFLEIDEPEIPRRIADTRERRGKEWDEYVSKKGSDEEIYQYYMNQQKLLLNLLKETSISSKIYNTTNMDFDNIAKDILEVLFSDSLERGIETKNEK